MWPSDPPRFPQPLRTRIPSTAVAAQRYLRSYGPNKRSISSTSAELYIFARAYRTETGTALDKDLYQECLSLIEATALSQQRPKNIATFANVAQFIKDGIFGEQFVM